MRTAKVGTILPWGGDGGTGGPGVVALEYPGSFTIANPGGGLTVSTNPSPNGKITIITAGSGNVSWS